MKRITFLIALLVALATTGLAQRPPTLTDDDIAAPAPTKSKPAESATSNTAPMADLGGGWVEVAPAASGFKVALPGKPTANTKTQEFPALGKVEHYALQVNDGKGFYQITYFRLPASASVDTGSPAFRQAFLNGIAQGLVKNLQGELLQDATISHAGSEGREVQIKTPHGVVWSRIFLVNGMMYSLSVLSNGNETGGKDRFFKSFSTVTK